MYISIKNLLKFGVFVILVNSVISCTTYRWVSDIKSPSYLNSDLLYCKNYSYEKFPARYVYRREADINISPYSLNTSPYYRDNVITIDANKEARINCLNMCMDYNGWKLEAVK